MKFVIEHLEPELYEWCLIEYGHISKIVGAGNLIFTNLENKKDELKKYGKVYKKNVSELNFKGICILSQYSKKTLTKNDKSKFQYFVFGGILGDNPAKRRTNLIINQLKNKTKFETRNLGKRQMPTDSAVYVAKRILEGRKLSNFKFVDKLEIKINENESVILPFSYAISQHMPVISEKMVDYLRRRKEF